MPALQEPVALLFDRRRHQRSGAPGQFAQLGQMPEQHRGESGAFALTGGQQRLQGRARQFRHLPAPVGIGRALGVTQADDVGHAERRGVGQPGPNVVLDGAQPLQQARGWIGQRAGRSAAQYGANLDLAALEPGGQQLAQGRLMLAKLVGQAQGQVQKAAVDRADFEPEARRCRAPRVGFRGGRTGAALGARVPCHAVNWHCKSVRWWSLRGHLEQPLTPRLSQASPPVIMSKVKPAPLPPDTVIGGYRVVRKVSAGGFGLVYLAVDNEGQQVAVKEYLPSSLATRGPGELLPQVQPEKLSLYRLGLKSFFEEGRALAQISHPSVVSVLNFFRENETVYMVMNFLEGATLQDFIIAARELKEQPVFRESTI